MRDTDDAFEAVSHVAPCERWTTSRNQYAPVLTGEGPESSNPFGEMPMNDGRIAVYSRAPSLE